MKEMSLLPDIAADRGNVLFGFHENAQKIVVHTYFMNDMREQCPSSAGIIVKMLLDVAKQSANDEAREMIKWKTT